MKIGLFLIGLLSGFALGFAVAAWSLYEPAPTGPTRYTFRRSSGPVPEYAMDGTQKRYRIECISASEKDCPQPIPVFEPGTVALLLIGLAALGWSRT